MSWRTVVISSRCKLDTKMGYMVVRGEEVRRIFLDEIAVVIVENPAVAMTGCLLSELMERKIKVIFCDSRHMPQGELVPYYGSHDSSRKLRIQIGWEELVKGAVWGNIIAEKIRQQARFLQELNYASEAELLEGYISQIEFQDATNREGHAAKVYFNAVFGMDFSRRSDHPRNAALNYGYSILLSAFNREIAACGYATQLGLHHGNVFNQFNLSSDLMEPFRILIDRAVYREDMQELTTQNKRKLTNVLNEQVSINGTRQTVMAAIGIYVRSVFDALTEKDSSRIKFYEV
ncbi:MAG: type II CRISPR-associated endonuclease Cas1 [Ruminococcaceae bacterium]|nr:type II CRISPR-associated endonuclease Cas1 [Oscillospiraceae bacterium]